uniref:Uncharacterized protein n=1 Tax=Cacopsylla melanoneura TaxID=428564 RepID=A0A8D8SU31_9HEMI
MWNSAVRIIWKICPSGQPNIRAQAVGRKHHSGRAEAALWPPMQRYSNQFPALTVLTPVCLFRTLRSLALWSLNEETIQMRPTAVAATSGHRVGDGISLEGT